LTAQSADTLRGFLFIGAGAGVVIMIAIMKLLLWCVLIASLTFVTDSARAGSFTGALGLQLYSLRDGFSHDVPGTLDLVTNFGFVNVELAGTYGKTPEEFQALLAARGVKAIAGHFSFERFKNDPEGVAREARTLGMQYAGCPWIPHTGVFDEQQCRAAAAVFNHAGAVLASQGIRFYYHTHGYEFQPFADGTLFDLLMHETNPKYVSYEMDVMWVVFPGQDPVKLLLKYGPRWKLMHLKDLRKGVVGNLSGGTDQNNDVPLGTGQTDWPAVLKTAQKVGVKWYFIEDESHAVRDQMPVHLSYLKQVSW
jgi:sugar phosphate isomerase/epimerase